MLRSSAAVLESIVRCSKAPALPILRSPQPVRPLILVRCSSSAKQTSDENSVENPAGFSHKEIKGTIGNRLEESAASRRVEQRIKEHKAQLASGEIVPPDPTVLPPLKVVDDSVVEDSGPKDVVIRSRTTTGQVLYPATPEDIEILSQSKRLYPRPLEVEGSVIVRLVRLSDPVTSPVARVVRNAQFGIRGNEKWQLLGIGLVSASILYTLGVWQLQRMKWKRDLVELRRSRLAMPRVKVAGSPFPWHDCVEDYEYRIIELRGVFDHRNEMKVGPRPGTDDSGETNPGYLMVTPLYLEDGSTVLVNRGHCPGQFSDRSLRPEATTWVRVRGVLEAGEIPNFVASYARLKNRPSDNRFLYLIAKDLAENSGARNLTECGEALVTAHDVLYEDDAASGIRRKLPFTMRHKEDYLLFWADEHTHFNYACQWFGMGTLIFSMALYKFIEVSRWRF
eukprot:gnl/MRDRNA2_/MRDRNA2_106364_c0_seq1.p1 gnl/MRDRNA2_/MRDRNA2_106364_c0~~gnl/MRDRNA2_/MRDRNA2_106364_c0_seq1.p1  ORF type:complete len:451 (-),score=48.94 gnl/MRDRNA2_/MRDRNA2_106364_c0_seq1:14-1366(-)